MNTCYGQSVCFETVQRFHLQLKETFSNSVSGRMILKTKKSAAVQISTVFGTL